MGKMVLRRGCGFGRNRQPFWRLLLGTVQQKRKERTEVFAQVPLQHQGHLGFWTGARMLGFAACGGMLP